MIRLERGRRRDGGDRREGSGEFAREEIAKPRGQPDIALLIGRQRD